MFLTIITVFNSCFNFFSFFPCRDVVALVTDGASVMKSVAKQFQCLHLLCICHGIHLCVVDVIYSKKNEESNHEESNHEQFQGDEDSDSENEVRLLYSSCL